jgi:hypothetical protein
MVAQFAHERHNLSELADTRPGSRAYGISPFGRRRRLSCAGAQALMLEECLLRERAAPISTKPVSHHRRRRCILSSWTRFLTGSGAPLTFVWTISTQWSAASRVDGGLLRVRAEGESKSEGASRQPNESRVGLRERRCDIFEIGWRGQDAQDAVRQAAYHSSPWLTVGALSGRKVQWEVVKSGEGGSTLLCIRPRR